MSRYKTGDLVWVAGFGPERAGVILRSCNDIEVWVAGGACWRVEVQNMPGELNEGWICLERYLRPRRDDYQQHEPHVTRTELDSVIRTEGPAQGVTPRETEKAILFGLRYGSKLRA